MSYISAQQSLNNVYRSVQFDNPNLAGQILVDVGIVQFDSLNYEKTEAAKVAANRLRRVALDLPVIQNRVLQDALTELGY